MSADGLHARILSLVGEVMGLLDLVEFRDGLLSALGRAVPSDYISLNEVGTQPERNWSVVQPSLSAAQLAQFHRLATQNPLADHFLRTRDGRPLRISDIVTPEQFHATELYRELYASIHVEYQIALALPSDGERILAIALSRGDGDFSDEERELLTIARPYLIQAYRNALDYTDRAATASLRGPDEPDLMALGLTSAQARVLRLLALGRSTAEIAAALEISVRTVNKHLQRIYQALGVTDRFAASGLAWSQALEPATAFSAQP